MGSGVAEVQPKGAGPYRKLGQIIIFNWACTMSETTDIATVGPTINEDLATPMPMGQWGIDMVYNYAFTNLPINFPACPEGVVSLLAGSGCSRAISSANAGSLPPSLTATHAILQHGTPYSL